MTDETRELFGRHNGILKTSELHDAGYHYQKIQALCEANEIEPIRRGYYRYIDENSYSDIPVLAALFPDGVLCLESALDYYGYVDRTPSAWHIAVEGTTARTRFNVDCVRVKPHFVVAAKFLVGMETVEIDGCRIRIYNRERTMCDLLSHRNKVDAETYAKAVQRYVDDPEKDVARLMKYAKRLHVERKAREVLGAWL
ncbi:type IV toxin-antitoxin system AbiEi family antitoxin domain-containing protein [Bifidobacterium panos]|uniref:AbiEi antitoxin N-terminal domain-containing protein n=1 Tax=Bifidobacterium panos TaxID=2675321 RepID=A0ABX1SYV1_9BIFI|nr:type IV toxin-antitoxin system AbiEi family antitoxin domain-containing protein [Bifidobacterium sp. DSM 109963]NMN02083.1 hypothetical protein [Bifidobacterium sp. DSM 109963]